MKKVSVIMPTYKRNDLLEKAIQSVCDQTYPDWELMVIDDSPEGDAEMTVKKFTDPRIRYLKNENNSGAPSARNRGIRASTGDVISFLDDDDEWTADKLEVQMRRFADTPPDVGFCFSGVINVFDNHEEVTTVEDGVFDFSDTILRRFKGFIGITVMIKKEVLDDVGLWDESLPSHQELDLLIRITRKYKGLGINVPVARVRMLSSHDHIGSNKSKKIGGRIAILEKYKDLLRRKPMVLAQHYFWLAIMLRDNNQIVEARSYLRKALRLKFRPAYALHLISLFGNAAPYKLFRKFSHESK